MKNTKKEKFSIDKIIQNSKFNFCKSLKFSAIIPTILIIAGIVLAFTLGFAFNSSVKGYTSVKVCANTNGVVQNVETKYDLDKKGDLKKFKAEIAEVLGQFDQKAESYQVTTMNIGTDLAQPAIEVRLDYVGGKDQAQTDEFLASIRAALQEKFGQTGVGEMQISKTYQSPTLLTNCLIAVLVCLVLAFVYMAFRFDIATAFAGSLAVFHDLLIMLALVLICRLPIGVEFTAIVIATMLYSFYNHIVVFSRTKENQRSGVYERAASETLTEHNARIANISVKETLVRSVLTATIAIVLTLLLIAFGVTQIRLFVLPLLFAIVATFFSSTFITPGLWALAFRPKKKKIAK